MLTKPNKSLDASGGGGAAKSKGQSAKRNEIAPPAQLRRYASILSRENSNNETSRHRFLFVDARVVSNAISIRLHLHGTQERHVH
jgi:hypothetical protein